MAKHLTDSEIEKIAALLTGWRGQLSWELLSKSCERIIGRAPSRKTLARAERIALAFRTTKDRLKHGANEVSPSITLQAAQGRIARLEAENTQLKLENRLLLEQFVRWQYNAHKAGLSEDRLNEALPRIDLRAT